MTGRSISESKRENFGIITTPYPLFSFSPSADASAPVVAVAHPAISSDKSPNGVPLLQFTLPPLLFLPIRDTVNMNADILNNSISLM